MTSDKADFTQGNILKKLVAFMMPVLGALILQAAYGAVDLLVVGRFGSTSGLSAVSTGSQVLNLVTFVVIQFAMGITVLIARYLGRKKTGKDRGCHWWRNSGIYHDVCRAVYCDGWICPSYFRSDAGTGGGCRSDCKLCKNLRCRYFLYCSVQPVVRNFPWTGRQ